MQDESQSGCCDVMVCIVVWPLAQQRGGKPGASMGRLRLPLPLPLLVQLDTQLLSHSQGSTPGWHSCWQRPIYAPSRPGL